MAAAGERVDEGADWDVDSCGLVAARDIVDHLVLLVHNVKNVFKLYEDQFSRIL